MARPVIRWGAGVLLVASSVALAAIAQTPGVQSLFQQIGPVNESHLGAVVGGAGDVDGDNRDDLVAGNRNLLTIYSGGTGQPLYSIQADRPGDFEQATVLHVADVTNDNRPDLIVAAPFANAQGQPGAGVVYLYNGATGQRLLTILGPMVRGGRFGAAVVPVDVNGDGIPELAVGAPLTPVESLAETGNVFIVSLANGSILRTIKGPRDFPGGQFGSALAVLDSLNAGGTPDLAVGAPLADAAGLPRAGIVRFISPVDGTDRGGQSGIEAQGQFGASLANAGDLNGDGHTDLIIGAPGRSVRLAAAAGQVIVYSRADGHTLYALPGTAANDRFGTVVLGGQDVNGDGRPDIIVGAPLADVAGRADAGLVRIYSGADGKLLRSFEGSAGDQLGTSVAFAGDINGDARTDLIMGAPFFDVLAAQDVGIAFAVGFAGA